MSKATLLKREMQSFMSQEQLDDLIKFAIERAKQSDIILKFVLEQNLGKAPQRVELTGKDGEPIQVSWL